MSAKPEKEELKNNDNKDVATCSWWSPWLEAAKLKSNEVFHFIKNDLNEISTVVKSEAASVISSTTNILRDTFMLEEPNGKVSNVKKHVSSLFDTVSNALNPVPEDDDIEVLTIKNDTAVKLSPLQIKIHELIKDPNTFLLDIEEHLLQKFNLWLENLDDQLSTNKLEKLLVASPALQKQYEVLVPQHVSHILFWKRFLFRKAILEDEELGQIPKKETKQQVEQVQWEKEDFAQCIELSEEEQIRILNDYEKEKKKSLMPDMKGAIGVQQQELPTEELKMSNRKDLTITADTSSSQISSSSGDTEGKDMTDDWEKDFELDVELEGLAAVK